MTASVELTVVFGRIGPIRALLPGEGIESFVNRTDIPAATAVGGGSAGPFELWVDEADLDRARELLA